MTVGELGRRKIRLISKLHCKRPKNLQKLKDFLNHCMPNFMLCTKFMNKIQFRKKDLKTEINTK